MSRSRRTVLLAAGILMLAMLACSTSSPTLPAPAPAQTSVPSATQAGSQATATLASAGFPTVTPVPSSTLVPTPTASATRPARTPVATKPAAPAAKLEFTLDDIEYSQSSKRKGDNKVQMTVTLHPRGGLPPYSIIVDGVTYSGLTHTFDWHNCDASEPHDFTVISTDGQQSAKVSIILPYHC